MEKKLKTLKVVNKILYSLRIGIILLGVLFVGFVIIEDNLDDGCQVEGNNLSLQIIEAFNANWAYYEGNLRGTQVKALINKIISNNYTYSSYEELEKIISVTYIEKDGIIEKIIFKENTINEMEEKLNNLLNVIESRNMYEISFEYNEIGLIDNIVIYKNVE